MMTSEERDAVYQKCLSTYGGNPQIDLAVEEMSELTKALLKWKRVNGVGQVAPEYDKTSLTNAIIDELADVHVMIRQMELLFDCGSAVEERIDYKVNRQIERLKESMIDAEQLVVYPTDKGRWAVRPISWAVICSTSDGRIEEDSMNHIAVFRHKDDAEEYCRIMNKENKNA